MARTTRSLVTPDPLWGSWKADEHAVEVEAVPAESLRGVRTVAAVYLDGAAVGYVVSQVNGRRTDWGTTDTARGWHTERPVYHLTSRPAAVNEVVETALRG